MPFYDVEGYIRAKEQLAKEKIEFEQSIIDIIRIISSCFKHQLTWFEISPFCYNEYLDSTFKNIRAIIHISDPEQKVIIRYTDYFRCFPISFFCLSDENIRLTVAQDFHKVQNEYFDSLKHKEYRDVRRREVLGLLLPKYEKMEIQYVGKTSA